MLGVPGIFLGQGYCSPPDLRFTFCSFSVFCGRLWPNNIIWKVPEINNSWFKLRAVLGSVMKSCAVCFVPAGRASSLCPAYPRCSYTLPAHLPCLVAVLLITLTRDTAVLAFKGLLFHIARVVMLAVGICQTEAIKHFFEVERYVQNAHETNVVYTVQCSVLSGTHVGSWMRIRGLL